MKETTALPSWISMSQVVGVLLKLLLMCVTAREISSLPVLPILGPSEIACSWGASVTIQPFVAAEESKCGPSFATWHVRLDSGQNLKSPVDVYLGDLATTQGPLKLTVNKTASNFFVNKDKQLERFEGVLRRSGTYVVQMTRDYATCPTQQAETRFAISACPAQVEEARYQLQDCQGVKQPGKRQLSLVLSAFDPDSNYPISQQWQLLPAPSSSSFGPESLMQLLPRSLGFDSPVVPGSTGSTFAAFTGSTSGPPAATCQAKPVEAADAAAVAAIDSPDSTCTLYIGSGKGRLQPGKKYVPMFKVQNSLGAGVKEWQALAPVDVQKCPPRILEANATLMGSCGSASSKQQPGIASLSKLALDKKPVGGRWVELRASAVDVEEGPEAALQYFWYVLLARTRNVLLTDSTSGRVLKIGVGHGPRQLQPGRAYLVKVGVVARSGAEVTSTKQQVGRVLEIPPCS